MGMDLDKFTDYMMEESGMQEMFSSMEISFKDGKATMSGAGIGMGVPTDYEQDGSKIMIEGEEFTVSFGKLIMEYTAEGMGTVKITFKQK